MQKGYDFVMRLNCIPLRPCDRSRLHTRGSTIKSKTAEELADEIIRGEWGSNPERRENITAQYGAEAYEAAQAIVNERMG